MEPDADGFINLGVLAPAQPRTLLEPAAPLPVGDDGFADLSSLPEGQRDYAAASQLQGVYTSASDILSGILEADDPHDAGLVPEAAEAETDGVSLSDLPTFDAPKPANTIAEAEAHLRHLASQLLIDSSADADAAPAPQAEAPAPRPSPYRVEESAADTAPLPTLPPEGPGGSDAFAHLFGGFDSERTASLLAVPPSAVEASPPATPAEKRAPAAILPAPHSQLGIFACSAAPDPSAFAPEPETAVDAARRFAALSPARHALPPRLQAMMAEGLSALLSDVGAPPLESLLVSAGLDSDVAASAAAAPAFEDVNEADEDEAPPATVLASQSVVGSPPLHKGLPVTPTPVDLPSTVTLASPLSPGEAVAPTKTPSDASGSGLRIAVAQVHASRGDVAANLAVVESVLASLAGRADLAVFPETFLTGYHIGPTLLRELAVTVPSASDIAEAVARHRMGGAEGKVWVSAPPVHPLLIAARAAAQHGVAVCLPYAEKASDGAVYNSVTVFDSDGYLVAHYRKTQLWHDPAAAPYELAAFKPGPGPALTHATLRHTAPVVDASGRVDPYTPFSLAAHSSVPIGLLVCFDCEFPEPARILALRGARVVVGVVASGEPGGFTSQRIVPTRAAENHVCFAWCNLPSAPPPPWGREPPPDAPLSVQCSGGSTAAGPDGRPLFAMPVYPCAPHRLEGPPGGCAWGEPACIDVAAGAAATAAVRLVRAEGASKGAAAYAAPAASVPGDAQPVAGGVTVALTPAWHHPASPTLAASDEAVFVVRFDPRHPRYADDARRNPYLTARRPSLYASLVAQQPKLPGISAV